MVRAKGFRAVILTSLTTISGLIPLLFENSTQAQFLKPMAITIVFWLVGYNFFSFTSDSCLSNNSK